MIASTIAIIYLIGTVLTYRRVFRTSLQKAIHNAVQIARREGVTVSWAVKRCVHISEVRFTAVMAATIWPVFWPIFCLGESLARRDAVLKEEIARIGKMLEKR